MRNRATSPTGPADAEQLALPLTLCRRAERTVAPSDVRVGLVEAVSMIARLEGAAGLAGRRRVLPWLGRARARLVAAYPDAVMPACVPTPELDAVLLPGHDQHAGLELLLTRLRQTATDIDDLPRALHVQEALELLDRGRRSLDATS